ncbi:dynacortin [Cavenderia fasciculata]|uniref:Dynacortin n=1 Tax=Cavenderia fasciculata TaxID=261658 RepID=F4PXA3_CACFS|nr:dynacortin [Cavenderia fasciculata]EGG19906.1 dynacortin [Cavenderia fasciculata]|eukprot:XP_004366889.1 dynacortin [Cavenderia fasciculata]
MQGEDLESREEQRLSRALQGKVGANKRASIWAPVQTKPTTQVPVNFTGTQSLTAVDTASPYANTSALADEKMRQEQARLKKWGLDTNGQTQETSETSSTASTPGLQSSQSFEQQFDDKAVLEERRLTKMGLSSTNLLDDYVVPASKSTTTAASSNVDESSVDNSSILSHVDGTPSEEKMRQEQKRLERWGLTIGGVSPPSASATSTPVVSSQPSSHIQQPPTPTSSATPSSPFAVGQAQTVASQYNLSVDSVKPFLDKIIYAAKSVKLILHKKSSNHEVTIAILMDLVQQSASFAVNLSADLPISFDISQSAGKLAGAVNELVKGAPDREPVQTIKIYEEIQSLLGLLYLGVVAH